MSTAARQPALWPDLEPELPTCDACGEPLPPSARTDALYCSVTCRVRAHRQQHKIHL